MATDRNGYIEVEGLADVSKALKDADKGVCQAAYIGLQKGALGIINDAKENLRSNGSVVTGLLRASGHVQKGEDGEIIAGFFCNVNAGTKGEGLP